MVEVVEEEVGASHDDASRGAHGEQPEEGLAACMGEGRVEGELAPRKSYDCVVRCVSYKVVDKGEGVVDMVGDRVVVEVGRVVDTGVDKVVGTVEVGVGSMGVDTWVRMIQRMLVRISLILGLILLKQEIFRLSVIMQEKKAAPKANIELAGSKGRNPNKQNINWMFTLCDRV